MATVLSFIVSIERPFWMMNTKAEMLHIKHAEMVVDKPTRETVPIPTKRETLCYLDFGVMPRTKTYVRMEIHFVFLASASTHHTHFLLIYSELSRSLVEYPQQLQFFTLRLQIFNR